MDHKSETPQYKLPGFTVDASLNRTYPLGAAMTPALGYMGHITDQNIQNIIKEGKIIEKNANQILYFTREVKKMDEEESSGI